MLECDKNCDGQWDLASKLLLDILDVCCNARG